MFRYLAEHGLTFLLERISALLLSLGSNFSLASLFTALWIAIAVVLFRRRPRKKDVKYKVMMRALFPNWLRRASFRADVWFLVFNVFAFAMLLGWTGLSSNFISGLVAGAFADTFGIRVKPGLNDFACRSIVTVSLFLAYELAYWIDHYLSHRIPLLWEFHKVHHTAEVLSPLTNFRMHPVDTVVFYNLLSIFLGTTGGVLSYLQLGRPFAVGGSNLILVVFIFVTVHLQHSHVWLATTGPLGRVILSPAHHQIHHSDNPIHFDKNFGACLSVWDWLFGTLCMPERRRERLNFGIPTRARAHHTVTGCLVLPFVRAWERVRPTATVEKPRTATPDKSLAEYFDAV